MINIGIRRKKMILICKIHTNSNSNSSRQFFLAWSKEDKESKRPLLFKQQSCLFMPFNSKCKIYALNAMPPKNVMSRHLSGEKTPELWNRPVFGRICIPWQNISVKPNERKLFFNLSTTYYNCHCHFQENKNEFKKDFFVSSKKP